MNALLALEDETAGVGFSVAVDRSLGGASLADGSLELMVHRRTQVCTNLRGLRDTSLWSSLTRFVSWPRTTIPVVWASP